MQIVWFQRKSIKFGFYPQNNSENGTLEGNQYHTYQSVDKYGQFSTICSTMERNKFAEAQLESYTQNAKGEWIFSDTKWMMKDLGNSICGQKIHFCYKWILFTWRRSLLSLLCVFWHQSILAFAHYLCALNCIESNVYSISVQLPQWSIDDKSNGQHNWFTRNRTENRQILELRHIFNGHQCTGSLLFGQISW